ncbi:tyrosine-type recombinase/integrase [Brumicola pallidula]|uniref:Integrase n=1 Tax=Brumicola pallidula DSM 14239 = ACAM 615 TaxID=1121922 RepID=K6ZJ10_9ALTE|nr:site-specific integrase [Glaciecola pallidula]GAC30307.1 hypothetical protein GPAL_3459 [Glaciecola pallidula DSM 14239 = ACAM 615]
MDTKEKHHQLVNKIKAGKATDAAIKAIVNNGYESLTRLETGLFLRISAEGTGFFSYQFTYLGKTRRMTLGTYGKQSDRMTLADARIALAEARALVKNGHNPLVERQRSKVSQFQTVDDLAQSWLEKARVKIRHSNIPIRIYEQEIKSILGGLRLDSITGLDIKDALDFVKERKTEQRPTIVNDTLTHLKQLFKHGVKLGVINHNLALAFDNSDAGGTEKSRTRNPTIEEWEIIFSVMRTYQAHFTRENYLAVALLLILGVRKGELISLQWNHMNFDKQTWFLEAENSKNGYALDIPLPPLAIELFEELKIRANGSAYVFPSRRASKRRGYISDDTLNHALTNLFGKKTGKLASSTGDVLGEAGIEYFVIHDIRRSTRTIMSDNNVADKVAEKAINHLKKGVEGIYNRDSYFKKRFKAHKIMAKLVKKIV